MSFNYFHISNAFRRSLLVTKQRKRKREKHPRKQRDYIILLKMSLFLCESVSPPMCEVAPSLPLTRKMPHLAGQGEGLPGGPPCWACCSSASSLRGRRRPSSGAGASRRRCWWHRRSHCGLLHSCQKRNQMVGLCLPLLCITHAIF